MADTTYELLIDSHASGNLQEEFRAAHTLKGTSRDMCFMRLYEPASKLADALRPNAEGNPTAPELVDELETQVTAAYQELVEAVAIHLP